MLFPINGNSAIAKALNEKIIAIETNSSLGFAFINGEIAAIAVAPQIAVPDVIKRASLFSMLKILPNKSPAKNTTSTKIVMYGKYIAVMFKALDADMVKPKITTPT
jgi:hypothetical protein